MDDGGKTRTQLLVELQQLRQQFRTLSEVQQQLIDRYERDLRRAHDMQMGLMPRRAPRMPGFDFAGYCVPARHVGGDLYKYHQLQDGRLVGLLADATGHAMEAMIPIMIFAGIVESYLTMTASVDEVFGNLNLALHTALPPQTFVCLCMGILEPRTRTLSIANSGCPYPFHYVAASGTLDEVALDGYPLGANPAAVYEMARIALAPGDRVVFCSDGVVETLNDRGEFLGHEGLADRILAGCRRGLSAREILRDIVKDVAAFRGDVSQADDITGIVVGAQERP